MLRAHETSSSIRRLSALALGLSALAAPSLAHAQDAQVENGFALMASLGGYGAVVGTTNVGTGNDVPLLGNSLQVGLFAGYKSGRILIGLGMDFSNVTVPAATGIGGGTTNDSYSTFLIGPDFMFAMLRSADTRVELIGDISLHFGHAFTPNDSNNPNVPSNFLLKYQLGPGVRFWAHRHFAFQALTGFAGELVHVIPPAGSTQTSGLDSSVHGIFAQAGFLGVF